MADNTGIMLDKIEKLIVDGNKQVIDRLERVEDMQTRLEDRQTRLEDRQTRLEDGQQKLIEVVKTVHSGLKNEIKATADALGHKIDEHMKQPAHA